jgi:pilus assembly protein CpaF
VVGEIRGDEAADLVQALNTGHDGSLSTLHANSPVEALARLESLVLQANPAWSLTALRDQVERSVDVLVHVERSADGMRRVSEISEIIVGGAEHRVQRLATPTETVRPLTRRR